jgi:hypothetical protein
MRKILVATVVAAGLVLTAAPVSAAFTDEAGCDLVSEEEIADYFGAAPTQTTPQNEEGEYTTCLWNLPPTEAGSSVAFIGIDKVNKLAKKDFKKKIKLPDAEKVDGIKKGFILPEGNSLTVTFIQNGNFVNVQYLGTSPEDAEANRDGLISMAQDLYDKL